MQNNKGFTLVELMVSLAMTGIIVAAVYAGYTLQQRTHTGQDQVVEMQQNIRAASLIMARELRMAGYDPASAGATFTAATATGVSFEQDITNTAGTAAVGDGKLDGPNERIGYGIINGALGRSTGGGGLQPIAENIEAIEFLYTLENASGTITQTTSPTASQFSDIRTITVSLLARAAWQDPKFVNSTIYTQAAAAAALTPVVPRWDLGAGAGVATNDPYRRRLLITSVQCRNMGL